MKQIYRKLLTLIVGTTIGISGLESAKSAVIYTETFPSGGSKSGWSITGNASIGQVEENDRFEFYATDYGRVSILANLLASDGAFAGDFPGAGIESVEFDLHIFEGSVVTDLFFELARFSVPVHRWQFALTPPALGTTMRYSVPVSPDGTGWTRASGTDFFSSTIAGVFEMTITLENSGSPAGSISGYIDNVTAIPEPGLPFMLAVGFFILLSSRRKYVASSRTRRHS